MMARESRSGERGSGLIVAVTILAVILGLSGAFLAFAIAQSKAAMGKLQTEEAARAVDGALAVAIARIHNDLKANLVPPPMISGTIAGGVGAGTRWHVDVKRNTANPRLWKLSAAASNPEGTRSQQVIIERPPPDPPPLPGGFRGALTSYYGFTNVKNIEVNGNDVTAEGADLPPASGNSGSDVVGVSTKFGGVTYQGGSGMIGGSGEAVSHETDGERVEVDPTWDYPTTPLEVLELESLPPGVLTFNTLAEWNNYLTSVNNVIPPNSFLNLTFQDGGNVMFDGVDWGDTEHILIWHHENPAINDDPDAPKGDATAQNIHLGDRDKPFRGIAILDDWRHVNGGSTIRGGMISLYGGGQQDGLQGNTQITYSSEAIGNALARAGGVAGPLDPPRVVSYRENVNDAESRDALTQVGMAPNAASAATMETSAGWTTPF